MLMIRTPFSLFSCSFESFWISQMVKPADPHSPVFFPQPTIIWKWQGRTRCVWHVHNHMFVDVLIKNKATTLLKLMMRMKLAYVTIPIATPLPSSITNVRIQKSDQTGDWTQAFWTYTRCSNHWAIQPCWVQSHNELYVSATPNHCY